LLLQTQNRKVLTTVDLYFQPHLLDRFERRVEPVDYGYASLASFLSRFAHPGIEAAANRVDHFSDRTGFGLHKVYVFGISSRALKIELLQGRASPERDSIRNG
jgi:hypothetical protein